uniref:Uncharacterized protein n=1 Tax=Anguilla anguilla TaxID=7936 RepID=A0A0E9PM40_ANGAN
MLKIVNWKAILKRKERLLKQRTVKTKLSRLACPSYRVTYFAITM